MINFAQRRIGRRRSIFQCSDGGALQRVHAMRRQVGKSCCGPIPTTLVTAERFSAAVTFLMRPPEDSLGSALSKRDERLLTRISPRVRRQTGPQEANRLLGCLGWVQF